MSRIKDKRVEKMKKRILAAVAALIILIAVPLFSVKNNVPDDLFKLFCSDSKNSHDIINTLAYEYREEYSDEALKAIAIILNSNYKAGKKLKSTNKTDFIKKHGKDNYSKIEKTIDDVKDICITYKDKPAPVPYCYLSGGNSERSAKHPFIKTAACPWDLLNKEYDGSHPDAVSLNSINKLCENGYSYAEALAVYIDGKLEKK